MIGVDAVFADDREHSPAARSLLWEETRGGVTVVVEPKPHWAADLRAFRSTEKAYCYYADWTASGPGARFFKHPETSGNDVMMKARALIAREISDGLWR